MGHSEDGYFKGELMEIQHKIFIGSSHRSSVRHVFPPCPHRKIQFQTALLLANDRTGKKSREQTRWSTTIVIRLLQKKKILLFCRQMNLNETGKNFEWVLPYLLIR